MLDRENLKSKIWHAASLHGVTVRLLGVLGAKTALPHQSSGCLWSERRLWGHRRGHGGVVHAFCKSCIFAVGIVALRLPSLCDHSWWNHGLWRAETPLEWLGKGSPGVSLLSGTFAAAFMLTRSNLACAHPHRKITVGMMVSLCSLTYLPLNCFQKWVLSLYRKPLWFRGPHLWQWDSFWEDASHCLYPYYLPASGTEMYECIGSVTVSRLPEPKLLEEARAFFTPVLPKQ